MTPDSLKPLTFTYVLEPQKSLLVAILLPFDTDFTVGYG